MDYGSNYGGGGYTSYGAGGGAGAGGFSTNYGGSQGGSQASPGGSASRGSRSASTLRPVTIRQVLEATQPHPEAEFKIDDVELTQLTLVAQIRGVSEQATNHTYKMDDGTGTLEVKQWVEATAILDGPSQKLQPNQYVRVLGTLKAFGGKRHLGAHHIRPITDFNEIHYHLLEATAIHLHLTKGPPELLGQTAGGMGHQAYGQGHGRDVPMGGMGAAAGGGGGALHYPSNASPLCKRILDIVRSKPQHTDGTHVNTIAQMCNLPLADVERAVYELADAGLAYTTIDDNHIMLLDHLP
ncbi:replication protein A, subunit RPA32 [Tuber magnatum]|uniref:Replication protein A, subunit RPA32 n=1 Tax=Tuber magnatum TaxID=42249 RepID=A0A317STQ5_9PEZI|nr:replication protein A, subunit RPA32 [Tuber magnatum]